MTKNCLDFIYGIRSGIYIALFILIIVFEFKNAVFSNHKTDMENEIKNFCPNLPVFLKENDWAKKS